MMVITAFFIIIIDGSLIMLPHCMQNNTSAVPEVDKLDLLHEYVQRLLTFISEYRNLYDFHAVDFFVNNTVRTLPAEWQDFIQVQNRSTNIDVFLDKMISFAGGDINTEQQKHDQDIYMPSSLQHYHHTAHTIGLVRDPSSCTDFIKTSKAELDSKVVLGMTPKKVHEVELLAGYVNELCLLLKVDNLVDIGAGQGYLSSVLAMKYGLHVIGVDYDTIQTNGANRRRELITKRYGKKRPDGTGSLIYLNKTVTSNDTFGGLVAESMQHGVVLVKNESYGVDSGDSLWGAIGLHTCGDLAPNMLRIFSESSAMFIVNIGCCYNHISEAFEEPDSTHHMGFPMSNRIRGTDVQLGWTARMLACQSTCRWPSQGRAREAFMRHFYRALLQTGSSPRHIQIHTSKIRHGQLGSFASYFIQAMQRLENEETLIHQQILIGAESVEQIADEYWTRFYPAGLKEIAFMWTLRAMMAEAIESLILVDRWLWLREARYVAKLFPLFGHIDSPRNLCIVGTKFSN